MKDYIDALGWVNKLISDYGLYRRPTVSEASAIKTTLEKQIPKKPERIMEKSLIGENFWWYCGHCGASRHTGSKSNYCSHCGGKVDWTK